MTFSTLDQVVSGTRVFIDAPIFIYHFTGASQACRTFLRRCEIGELDGVTSVITLSEVTHRLMMLEASISSNSSRLKIFASFGSSSATTLAIIWRFRWERRLPAGPVDAVDRAAKMAALPAGPTPRATSQATLPG